MTASDLPPRWLAAARRLIGGRRREEAEGDLIELWHRRRTGGRRWVGVRFWMDVASLAWARRRRRAVHVRLPSSRAFGIGLWSDLRFTWRLSARQPGFAAVVLFALIFGIAAATAIYTIADRTLLAPLPYPDPERLVALDPLAVAIRREADTVSIQPADVRSAGLFTALGLYEPGGLDFDAGGDPIRLNAAAVDSGFFDVLAVPPMLGRVFTRADDRGVAVVVLAHEAWRRVFGSDPSILGRRIVLSGRPYAVVGVMAPDVTFPEQPAVWIPVGADARMTGGGVRGGVIGRLAPGVSIDRATEVLAAIKEAAFQEPQAGPPPSMSPLQQHLTAGARPTLLFLVAVVSLLLAASSASVASLLLARLGSRTREFRVRAALGASRARLVRQVLIEALWLGVVAGTAGFVTAIWMSRVIVTSVPALSSGPPGTGVDGRAFAVGAALSLLSCFLFSLAPVAGVMGGRVAASGEGRTATGWPRFAPSLLIAQMAVAVVLLAAASTALAIVTRASRLDFGVRNGSALTFQVTLPASAYATGNDVSRFAGDLEAAYRGMPGVRAVGLTNLLPGATGTRRVTHLAIAGLAGAASAPHGILLAATPDYFRAMGAPLIAGRFFEPGDAGRDVVILNETAARALDPDVRQVVRQRLTNPDAEIVGVVGDLRMGVGLPEVMDAIDRTHIYAPLRAHPPQGTIGVALDVGGDFEAAVDVARRGLRAVDPALTIFDVSRAGDLPARLFAAERLRAVMAGVFSVVVIGLGALGLYGVLAQLVTQRQREMGIRVALGASRRRVHIDVLWPALRLVLVGIAAGVVLTGVGWRLASRAVPELEAPSAAALGVDAIVLLIVACLAAWIPARRASAVDPATALRAE